MELTEYYEKYRESLADKFDGAFPRDIASCIAAGYYAGLSVEQLNTFITKRAEISSVSVALANQNTSVQDIEKIVKSRKAGNVYPAEILRDAFEPEEIKTELRVDIFRDKNA